MPQTTEGNTQGYPLAGNSQKVHVTNLATSTSGTTAQPTDAVTTVAGIDATNMRRAVRVNEAGEIVTEPLNSTDDEIALTRGPRAAPQGATKRLQTQTANAQEFMPARPSRRSLSLVNEDGIINANTNHIRWGYGTPPDQTSALANGALLPAGRSIEIPTQLAVWVIAVSATGAAPFVSGAEDYDNA